MAVSGSLSVAMNFFQSPDTGILAGVRLPFARNWDASFASGNGVAQVNRIHAKTYTFVASTPQTINLRSLVDLFGATFTDLAEARALGMRLVAADEAATLTAGNDGTANEWTSLLVAGSTMVLRSAPIGYPAWNWFVAPGAGGYPVGSANRLFKLSPSAHAFDLDFIILGSN